MTFLVTADFEILDPNNAFENLTEDQQTNLLYDATDMWEKHFGRSGPHWPEILSENRPVEDCVGEVIV